MLNSRSFRGLVLIAVSLILSACGGGGDDNKPEPVQEKKNFSFAQESVTRTLAAGQSALLLSTYVDCERTGTRCQTTDSFAWLLPKGSAPIGNSVAFHFNGVLVGTAARASSTSPWVFTHDTPGSPVVISEPGWIDMVGTLSPSATRGQEGDIGIDVGLNGSSTFEVTGAGNRLRTAVGAGSITDVTSENIPPGTGTKQLGGFRLNCPSDAVGGCLVTMSVALAYASVPIGTVIDVHAGDLWWYSTQLTKTTGGEVLTLDSPAQLTPGQSAWIRIDGAIASGTVRVRDVVMKSGDGYEIYIAWNFNCFERNILSLTC